MIEISFKKKPSFGDSSIKKIKKYEERKWVELPYEEFLKLTIKDFINPNFRCIVEFNFEGRVIRVVTHKEEMALAQEKYPQDLIVHITQIINMFKTAEDYKSEIPKILIPVGVLGAEVA